MIGLVCIGEPISWLRLETFAIDPGDPVIESHVTTCPACAQCLREITGDMIALRPLVLPPAKPKRSWWSLAPAMALAAAALIVLMLWQPGKSPEREQEAVVGIKGLGEVVLDVVRERGGVVREGVRSFAPGDRWKVVVTCMPSASATIEVGVIEGGTSMNTAIDHPLPRARIACGNRVLIPGAFTLTGKHPNRVCVKVASDHGTGGTACVTIDPEDPEEP